MFGTYNLLIVLGAVAGFLLTFQRSVTRGVVLLVAAGLVAIVADVELASAEYGRPWTLIPFRVIYGVRLLGLAFALGTGVALLIGWMRK